MATTSTYVTVKKQMVALYREALSAAARNGGQVQTSYAWPGPATEQVTVFLGRHPDLLSPNTTAVDSRIPNMKAGRKQRQEQFRIPVSVWAFLPDLTPADVETAEEYVFDVAGLVEGVHADDPKLDLTTTIQKAEIVEWEIPEAPMPFEGGYVVPLTLTVEVQARLS